MEVVRFIEKRKMKQTFKEMNQTYYAKHKDELLQKQRDYYYKNKKGKDRCFYKKKVETNQDLQRRYFRKLKLNYLQHKNNQEYKTDENQKKIQSFKNLFKTNSFYMTY